LTDLDGDVASETERKGTWIASLTGSDGKPWILALPMVLRYEDEGDLGFESCGDTFKYTSFNLINAIEGEWESRGWPLGTARTRMISTPDTPFEFNGGMYNIPDPTEADDDEPNMNLHGYIEMKKLNSIINPLMQGTVLLYGVNRSGITPDNTRSVCAYETYDPYEYSGIANEKQYVVIVIEYTNSFGRVEIQVPVMPPGQYYFGPSRDDFNELSGAILLNAYADHQLGHGSGTHFVERGFLHVREHSDTLYSIAFDWEIRSPLPTPPRLHGEMRLEFFPPPDKI
jgi:hypothetical protein